MCVVYEFIHRTTSPATLQLSGCDRVEILSTTQIELHFTLSDLNSLKLNRNLGTDAANSYITVQAGNGIRVRGNELVPVTTARQVDIYTPDSTRPEVVANGFVEFDLDSGQFTITFSEPVDTQSISTPNTLFFQHHTDVSLNIDSFEVMESIVCSPPICEDNVTVTFLLSRGELNRLKLNNRVCTSAATCWLTIATPGNFITDMAGNNVVELPNGLRSPSRYLGSYVDDITGPVLESFTLNMTSRELVLTFDEPVDYSTFGITGVTLQSGAGVTEATDQYQLTSGTLLTNENDEEMRVVLSDADINALQSRPNVATQSANTYLSMEARTVVDLSYQQNSAQAITNANAQPVAIYVPDLAPPEIREFNLDLDSNSMTLIFSEPVLVSTVVLDRLMLHSSRTSAVNYQLTGGTIHPTPLAASAEITFTFANADITFIEVSANIAMTRNDTYLSTLSGLADDTNGHTSVELPVLQALEVSVLTPDTSAPSVTGFTLDMNLGEMIISFNDVILGTAVDVSAITLQSALYRVPMEWHTLTRESSSSGTEDGFQIAVTIGNSDLNRLKQIRNLTTFQDNSYLTVTATLADDVNGVDVVAVTDGKSLQASQFALDSTQPALDSWLLDMDEGQIILTFSETVDILTLQPDQVSVQSAAGATDSYTLTGYADLIPPDADFRFAIQLNEDDANNIKTNTGLGTEVTNTYLTITGNTIDDMNSNDVLAITNGRSLQAQSVVLDQTVPILRSFSLDMNLGMLGLTFDETVNADTFNVSALTLVNRAFRSQVQYTLMDGVSSSVNSPIIEVTLSKSDVDNIKAISSLATGDSDTFITATPYTVEDMNENRLSAIASDSAQQVAVYITDMTRPQLDSFSLNMSSEQLVLLFTETVRASSLDPTQITIQSQVSTSIAGVRSISLTGGVSTQEDGTSVVLQLSEEDANNLKLYDNIATSTANTFLTITENAIRDPAGNQVVAITSNNARQASTLTTDSVSPRLVSFNLDLDQRLLTFSFDETVAARTFSITRVRLQDDQSNPSQTVTLGAFTRTSSEDGTTLVFDFSDDDFNSISATFPLAIMDTNTYIALEAGTVQDTSSNPSVEIPTTDALQISSLTVDQTNPTLNIFDFDLNLGILTLVFSESINVTSFDTMQITLQNAPSSPSATHTLRGGLVSQRSSTTVDIDLLVTDLNDIKATTNLASIRSDVYLSITSATVKDTNNNYVDAIPMNNAILVSAFVSDTSGPTIQGFDLDYNSGVFTLYFDETIDLSTFDASALLFQSGSSPSPTSVHTLESSFNLDNGLLTFTRVQLSVGDLNELKRLRICTTSFTCFISSSDELVQDVATNSNEALTALTLGSYIQDMTDPLVNSYAEFDHDSGTFRLEFSETVDVSSINVTQIKLNNAYTNATHTFEFTELSTIKGDNCNVTFQISDDDLNRLKLNTDLCTFEGNCWIRFSTSFLTDVLGNPVVPILPDTIDTFHQPQVYTPDTTPPILLSYMIDLDSGRMTFTFDEVIRLATFIPMNLTFQNAELATISLNLRESGTASRSEDGLSIEWYMTSPDLNLLKSYEMLFTSLKDSYLTYSYLVEDISGNGISPKLDGINALQASEHVPDSTRPQLESFRAFNFDNWTLTLQFDEPVNLSSIQLDEIAITHNSSFDLGIYDRIPINDWYSLYYENGTIYNLTHLFEPGEYIISCPFSLTDPTTAPPTTAPEVVTTQQATPSTGSGDLIGNFSGSGSGSGSGVFGMSGSGSGSNDTEENSTLSVMLEEMLSSSSDEDPYPLSLRGCTIYRNLTVVEPFYFLTGGELSYVDERKQQVNVAFNRRDLRALKISFVVASNDSNTWIAFNDTALSDMAMNAVIPTNLFNATKLQDGAFVNDVTPPFLEFIDLDMDSDVLSLHFSDVMDVQSVQPLLITISEYPDSNNSYTLQGPYAYPQPLVIEERDSFTISIPLSFDDMNTLKNNLELATSEFNTYVTFPYGIATDIYGRAPPGIHPTQVRRLVPDMTGAQLLAFDLDLNTGILTLHFDEVVNPNTIVPEGISIQNLSNSSLSDFVVHQFVAGGPPVVNDTGVSSLEIQLDLDLNALKVDPNLANTINDTYVTLAIGTVLDMNDNENQPVSDTEAIQASSVTEDISPPQLRFFDLNLNDNFLILKFSEAVFPDTFNASAITILSGPLSPDRVVLDEDSRIFRQEFESLIFIRLSADDEDELKDTRREIAKSAETTFLALEMETAEDYFGARVVNISEENPLPVREYFEGEHSCTCMSMHTTWRALWLHP